MFRNLKKTLGQNVSSTPRRRKRRFSRRTWENRRRFSRIGNFCRAPVGVKGRGGSIARGPCNSGDVATGRGRDA